MHIKNSGRRGGLLVSAAAGFLFLMPLSGCAAGAPAAQPDSLSSPQTGSGTSTLPPDASPSPSPSAVSAEPLGAHQLPVMGASDPVSLSIPSIGVQTDLLHLGLLDDGSLEVPKDTGGGAPASWYNGSPTPGEAGPSVILGHVNALGGNTGVFANLRKLSPGAEITVARTDGTTAVFTVERGALFNKDDFPTLEVYGNTPGAELRLITCDGFDPDTGNFDENYVIYAKLKA